MAPEFYPYAVRCYSMPSRMCSPGWHLFSEEGVHQGDVCGTLFFCLALQPVLEKLRDKFPTCSLLRAFADDINCGTALSSAPAVLELLASELRTIGLNINLSKCNVFGTHPGNLALLGIPSCSDGFVALGAPVGTQPFLESFLEKQTLKQADLFDKLNPLGDRR